MTVQTTTHLNFRGQARKALDFYRSVFGGERTIVTYGDLGATQDPVQAERVIWGQVASDQGFRIMAYDVQPEKPWNPGENAVYVSLRGTSPEEITAHWEKLRAGGSVLQPLGASAWSPLYGMLTDRFGVTWVMDVMVS
ncbi:VOC family protein [Methylobacterium sp. E-005]|uniref:VOC family protein n=1 Tax=Methylobacterium sp. E-005 TaxID=2836549 RepID=UPI001FBBB40C|nr:VOC family protein [Methylobacterium sp. E-005]MCJ2085007.1 VOC family protein [Methylobacterium sp. E-005]